MIRGTCGTDTIDSSLIQVEDERLVHVMVFVIGIEDDELVALVHGCDILPPCLEAGRVGYDVRIEAAVVVWLNHGVGTFAGDVVDGLVLY